MSPPSKLRFLLPALLAVGIAGRAPSSAETGWTPTFLPGPPSVFVADPGRAGVLYAATQEGTCGGGALFRSPTAGAEWKLVEVVPEGYQVSSFAVDPASSTVYAALYACGGGSPSRVYRSRDGGANWQFLQALGVVLTDLTPDPTSAGGLYGSGFSVTLPPECEQFPWINPFFCPRRYTAVLLRSSDAGVSWRQTCTGPLDNPASFDEVVIDSTDPDRLFARSPDALWTSTDGGTDWIEAAHPGCGVHAIALTGPAGEKIVAGLGSFLSTEFCPLATLSSAVERLQFESQPAGNLPGGEQGVDVESLAASPADRATVYAAYRAAPLPGDETPRQLVAVSHDGGSTWRQIPWGDGPIRFLAVDSTGAFLYAVTASDVFRWTVPAPSRVPRSVPFR